MVGYFNRTVANRSKRGKLLICVFRKFTCEISSGREQLLPQRDPDADPQKVVLLEREAPCRCGRGSNCFRVRTSAGRSCSAAIRRQVVFATQGDAMSIKGKSVKAQELRLPQDTARLLGSVVTWADPPGYEHEEGRFEGSP
jgi:hypothetical protein